MKKFLLSITTIIVVMLGAVAPVMAAEETTTLTPVQQQSQENHDAWSQAHGMPTNSSFVGTIAGILPVGIVLAIGLNVGRTALLLGGSTKKTSAVAKNEALASSANGSYDAMAQTIAMMDNAAANDANNNMMF